MWVLVVALLGLLVLFGVVTRYKKAAVVVLAVLFGVFVWPTPYQYVTAQHPTAIAVRVNRFTETADILTPSGWREAPETPWDEELSSMALLAIMIALGAIAVVTRPSGQTLRRTIALLIAPEMAPPRRSDSP